MASRWLLLFRGGLWMAAVIPQWALDGCRYVLVASGWLLLSLIGLWMDAGIPWWALDGCCYLLVASGWLLLFPSGLWIRVLLSVRPTPRGGGGLAEFQGGWVSNPPPPGVGWDFVGALGSIEPVPLLSFFCCRFHVTCLFMVCLHGIAYHVCMRHAHKAARRHCHLCQMRRGQR